MLNSKGVRELAYVVTIDEIRPIEGRDRVECAVVGGWTVMVRKEQFKPGDPAIYFEIDSKVPETEPFAFLAQKHYKIKTQKYKAGKDGQFWSQGLLMSAEDFGWKVEKICLTNGAVIKAIFDGENYHSTEDDSRFLTEKLKVTYAEAEDNKRKASSVDKYKLMAQRNGKLFSHQPFRFLMRRTWGKKLLFIFFGKKKDKKSGWPAWVQKTDEERVQNMPWILNDKGTWLATEKIDGTSTTFTIKRRGRKFDFYVCSRNVVFDKPDKNCFYDTNVYLEMAEKYDIYNKMVSMMKSLEFANCTWLTIQGETYGEGIQKRDYSFKGHRFRAFNLIDSVSGRWNSENMKMFLDSYDIPSVPILGEVILPDTVEEILNYATGESVIDGGMREGIVFRSLDGSRSFKAVSNEYLAKYHG